jgi:serine protease Do
MIGEPVIAIGNPFGLSHTITTGVISALNRTIRISEEVVFRGFIQTDAPINPGNSGGPLINILGDVIGINTAIYGNAQGIGFAIPIDTAKRIVDDLIAFGEVRRAWIGMSVQALTPDIARHFHYQGSTGVLIAQVLKNSAAERAGLKQGDILVKLDHNPIQNQEEYQTLIAGYTPGDKLVCSIAREGQSLDIEVTAEEFSAEQAARMASQDFGFAVEELTPQMIAKYRLQSEQGVVVTKIRENSPADQIGMQPGDIIRQVEDMQVAKLADFQKAIIETAQQSSVVFLIQRRSQGYYVTLERQ